LTVDKRPSPAENYEACVDGWVYGTDGVSSSEEESTTVIDSSTTGVEKKGQRGASVKFGNDASPVQVPLCGIDRLRGNRSTFCRRRRSAPNAFDLRQAAAIQNIEAWQRRIELPERKVA
jgi:hypothetical protein